MYRNRQFNFNNGAGQTNPLGSASPENERGKKGKGLLTKAVAITLSAALFGGVAGATFYGVNAWLGDGQQAQAVYASQSDGVDLANMSYSTGSSESSATSQSLDVTAIAEQMGLAPSSVSRSLGVIRQRLYRFTEEAGEIGQLCDILRRQLQ